MNTVRFPLLRGSLLLIALAAIAFIMARGDNPAQATTYNPSLSISVSDTNPGAAADIKIDFSLEAPDAFPNVRTDSSIQFLPRQWGIHVPETEEEMAARIGGVAGTFNALSTLGTLGVNACIYPIPVPFTMYDASPYTGYDAATGAYDPEKLTSALDLGGDAHPGGAGYSGQFAQDPDTMQAPPDLGLPLIAMNADEKHSGSPWYYTTEGFRYGNAYRDVDGNNRVSVGDVRLGGWLVQSVDPTIPAWYTVGSVVQAGDKDFFLLDLYAFWPNEKHTDVDGNGQMDPGEYIYQDLDNSGTVSYGDVRRFYYAELQVREGPVEMMGLQGGISRYPDFLNQMFPPEVVGEPLARMWAGRQVLTTAVSLNIVTFRPGQLPGYPASMGYPNVVVLLNPVAPVELLFINQTSDLCTPLSLTSTNFGVSQNNPGTLADEGGYVRLTNPKAEKSHDFTLVTTSQPDADDDGQENMLDSCPFDPNTQDLDGRNNGGIAGDPIADPERDALDAACDPEPGGPPPDYGRRLVRFNWNEKFWGFTCWTCSNGSVIYRDKDYSGNITPGDDRLMVRVVEYNVGATWYSLELQPGVVQDSDADYRDPVTGVVRPTYQRPLLSLQPTSQFNIKHSETVAANWRYDVGEDVYWDKDGSGDVSTVDERLFYEGQRYSNRDNIVEFSGQSPLGPWFHTPDEDLDNFANRADNCPVVPNGIEVVGATYIQLRGLKFNLLTYGDLIGPDNQADTDMDDIGDACEGSEHGSQCANGLDDDGDGSVNDGCPLSGAIGAESGAQCDNALDDDGDGRVNDGCPAVVIEEWGVSSYPWMCSNAVDDDGDGKVNDGCPALSTRGTAESGDQCANSVDDDGDGLINDGCPAVGTGWAPYERSWQCNDALDQDGDGYVNDGCPVNGQYGERNWAGDCANAVDDDKDGVVNDGCPVNGQGAEWGAQCTNDVDDDADGVVNDGCPANAANAETGAQCSNNTDDDGDGFVNDGCPGGQGREGWGGQVCQNDVDDDADGVVNDGCPAVRKMGVPESGDQCANDADDDADGLVNDGCPAVDPGGVAKTTPTGHKHVVTITSAVPIFKHGIKLANLGGPDKIKDNGARTYTVDVSNLSGSDSENVQVALRVVEGCATVDGVASQNNAEVSVASGESGSADFTVDFTGCPAGEYTVQADACHGGDPAPAGFFGSGGCPGFAGHGTPESGVVPLASAIASSEFESTRAAFNAIDGNADTRWCSETPDVDPNPVLTVYTMYSSDIGSLTLEDRFANNFEAGVITMSNGFSQDVTLTNGDGTFTFPTQTGVGWVRFTSATRAAGTGIACFDEVSMNGSWYVAPPDPNPNDDAYMTIDVEVGTTP